MQIDHVYSFLKKQSLITKLCCDCISKSASKRFHLIIALAINLDAEVRRLSNPHADEKTRFLFIPAAPQNSTIRFQLNPSKNNSFL